MKRFIYFLNLTLLLLFAGPINSASSMESECNGTNTPILLPDTTLTNNGSLRIATTAFGYQVLDNYSDFIDPYTINVPMATASGYYDHRQRQLSNPDFVLIRLSLSKKSKDKTRK